MFFYYIRSPYSETRGLIQNSDSFLLETILSRLEPATVNNEQVGGNALQNVPLIGNH